MPLPSSHSVAGRDPMPTTTRSAASFGAVGQHHRVDVPVAAHLRHPDADADVDALVAVQPRHQFADLLAEHRGQRRRLRLDQHHVHAEAAQAGRHLAADEAGADDDGLPAPPTRARAAPCSRRTTAAPGCPPDPGKLGMRRGTKPGRDDQFVVAERRFRRRGSRVCAAVSRPVAAEPRRRVMSFSSYHSRGLRAVSSTSLRSTSLDSGGRS